MSIEKVRNRVYEHPHPEKIAFWFVRHVESEGNTLGEDTPVMHDTSITKEGIKEAESIAEYLESQHLRFTHIFSSSRARSRQTAEIIAHKLGLPVVIKEGLDERNWGEHKDKPWSEVSKGLDKMSLDERYKHIPEGGESWEKMEERLLDELEKIARASEDGDNILIVTHRGSLRAIMPLLSKAGREKHQDFSVPLGSLSKFSFEKDEFDFVGLRPDSQK